MLSPDHCHNTGTTRWRRQETMSSASTTTSRWWRRRRLLPFDDNLTFLRNSASSFHWLSSSIFSFCSFVVRSSRIRDTSSHLHYMMFQTIQTIYFLWGYDPGNMSVSFIAELSPVYCCLVCNIKGAVHIFRSDIMTEGGSNRWQIMFCSHSLLNPLLKYVVP